MQLDQYFDQDQQHILFSREQASRFAKQEADDFNPLHDIDAKRFCVPGDLLFSVLLNNYGVSEFMQVHFHGMVEGGVPLHFPDHADRDIDIRDNNEKSFLSLHRKGAVSRCETLIDSLISEYVRFSGKAFPHTLVPLMADNNVMINPDRPMVMYQSMTLQLDRLDLESVSLKMAESTLDLQGKRANICLKFTLHSDGEEVGHGSKNMLLSGLKPYQAEEMDELVNYYIERKKIGKL